VVGALDDGVVVTFEEELKCSDAMVAPENPRSTGAGCPPRPNPKNLAFLAFLAIF
jgi:hypothetical protein